MSILSGQIFITAVAIFAVAGALGVACYIAYLWQRVERARQRRISTLLAYYAKVRLPN